MPRVRSALPFLLLLIAVSVAACREDGDIEVKAITFNGVKQVDKGALANALQTKAGSRFPWGKKKFFDRRAFEADLKRIEAFYRDRGFPDARITTFDVKLNDAQNQVRVTLDISEGEPVRVADIQLRGFDVLSESERRSLLGGMPLLKDGPLDRQLAVATRERALNALRDKGYPYADVGMHPEDAGPKRQTVILEATPGILARVGDIGIVGEQSVGENIVRRQLTFKPGDVYTRTKLRDSQRRLYAVELFQFANVEPLEDKELMLDVIPVRVTVAESKHQKITTGVGYGSEEKARAHLRWDHVNFLGNARQAGFEGRWSSLDRGVRVDFTEPYLMSPHFSLRFEGQAWQASEPVFSQNTVGGRVILRHQESQQTSWGISLINEYQRSRIENEALNDFTVRDELIALGLDPRRDITHGTVGAVAFDATRNTANNVLDATKGYVLTGHVEQAGGPLWGSYNYWAANGEGRYYQSLGRKMVFAQKLGFGSIDPQQGLDANVPFNKRFFLGGATSIRGWGRYEVSPLSGSGFPLGGLSMFEGTSELRLPVWGKLGAVGFVDYGNVWATAWDINLGDLRYAVGPGLRYLTPIGPARIDFGYQLNPIETLLVNGELQKRQWRVHFSIGQAF